MLDYNTQYYIRARHRGSLGTVSEYSLPVGFLTARRQLMATEVALLSKQGTPPGRWAYSLALSKNDTWLYVLTSNFDAATGNSALHLYENVGGTWSYKASLSTTNSMQDVSVSRDNQFLWLGRPWFNGSATHTGSHVLYSVNQSTGALTQRYSQGGTSEAESQAGYCGSISGDGTCIVAITNAAANKQAQCRYRTASDWSTSNFVTSLTNPGQYLPGSYAGQAIRGAELNYTGLDCLVALEPKAGDTVAYLLLFKRADVQSVFTFHSYFTIPRNTTDNPYLQIRYSTDYQFLTVTAKHNPDKTTTSARVRRYILERSGDTFTLLQDLTNQYDQATPVSYGATAMAAAGAFGFMSNCASGGWSVGTLARFT